jgi:uncharacterized protein involved in exopolysaccharide biosynthesis
MAEMESEYEQRVITPLDFARSVWHWKWLILFLVVSITGAVTMWSLQLPKIYFAEAKILLIWVREEVIRLPDGQSISSTAQRYQDLMTEIQLLQSHEMQQRVQALESGANLGSLVVRPEEDGTKVLTIGFADPDPERAARMVSHVIKAYTDFRSKSFYKTSDADSFLLKQINVNLDTLDQLRRKLDRFRTREQIIELGQQKGQLLSEFHKLETQLFEFTRQRTTELSRLNEFRALWKDRNEEDPLPPGLGGVDWSQASALQKQLSDLKLRRATLLEKYTPEYDEVVASNESIAIMQKILREKVNQLKALEEAAILSRVKVLQADEEILRGKLEELRVKLKDVPEIEQHHTDLSRGINDYEKIYTILLQNREQERLNKARNLNEVSIRILSPPYVPNKPIYPNVQKNISMAAVLSLFLGVGLAFVLDYFRGQKVRTPHDIEQMVGLPVLAQIRVFPSPLLVKTSDANGREGRAVVKTRVQKRPLLLPPNG